MERKIKSSVSKNDDLVIDTQMLNRKMRLVTNMKKRQEQYIIALLLSKDKEIIKEIFDKIKLEDIENKEVKKVYSFLIDLSKTNDLSKIDVITKIHDEELMKEITDIMYIDISQTDRKKLLTDVLKNKMKERLYLRRDEILKRTSENISKDEMEILQLELNQIIVELSKLK